MIDIHSHILPFIDDGSDSVDVSLAMLKSAIGQGISDIILTPHFDAGKKQKQEYSLKKSFELINELVIKEKLNINLHLGHEISFHPGVSKDVLNGNALPLKGSKYVLLELTHHTFLNEIEEAIYEMQTIGYTTIIAHLERYGVYNPKVIKKIRECGALIQINATAFWISNPTIKKAILKLVKLNLVDFIASDQHSYRENRLRDTYELIKKRFGTEKADFLFAENARKRLF